MNIRIRPNHTDDIASHRDLDRESPIEISRIDHVSGEPPLPCPRERCSELLPDGSLGSRTPGRTHFSGLRHPTSKERYQLVERRSRIKCQIAFFWFEAAARPIKIGDRKAAS